MLSWRWIKSVGTRTWTIPWDAIIIRGDPAWYSTMMVVSLFILIFVPGSWKHRLQEKSEHRFICVWPNLHVEVPMTRRAKSCPSKRHRTLQKPLACGVTHTWVCAHVCMLFLWITWDGECSVQSYTGATGKRASVQQKLMKKAERDKRHLSKVPVPRGEERSSRVVGLL